MTFPYFNLPAETHDRLGGILEEGNFSSVKRRTEFHYPPGITGPDPLKNPLLQSFLISEGALVVSVSSSFDATSKQYVAYVLLKEGNRREGRSLLDRVERLLEEHGAVKE